MVQEIRRDQLEDWVNQRMSVARWVFRCIENRVDKAKHPENLVEENEVIWDVLQE